MGFEQLKDIIKENKEQIELDNQEAINPIECPYCVWTLKENSKGEKSCEICGRIYGIRVLR